MAKKKNSYKKEMGRYYHKKTVVNNIVFDSETEAKYYLYLIENKAKLGIKGFDRQKEFIIQPKYILTPEGERIDYVNDKQFKKEQKKYPGCTIAAIKYVCDFKITYLDGRVEVIDIKGVKTPEFKIKEKMFNFVFPQYGGLKCITRYNGRWMYWDEYQEAKKAKSKNKKK